MKNETYTYYDIEDIIKIGDIINLPTHVKTGDDIYNQYMMPDTTNFTIQRFKRIAIIPSGGSKTPPNEILRNADFVCHLAEMKIIKCRFPYTSENENASGICELLERYKPKDIDFIFEEPFIEHLNKLGRYVLHDFDDKSLNYIRYYYELKEEYQSYKNNVDEMILEMAKLNKLK